jgi:hypothetical protein
MVTKATRHQRQARERKLEAADGTADGVVFLWGDEELVIRSESDLQEALRRIGLTPAPDTARKQAPPTALRQRLARPQGVGGADLLDHSRPACEQRDADVAQHETEGD